MCFYHWILCIQKISRSKGGRRGKQTKYGQHTYRFKGNEYQSYLRQQMEEKQRAKKAEIERMRKERIELEQHIKDAEKQRLDELYARKKSKSEYAAELQRQQRDDLEHRFQNEFAMGNKEREYHRQYLEPTQRMNQDVIGAFPRESPTKRDRRYLQ